MREESEEWKGEVVCPKVTQQVAGREQRTDPSLLTLDSLCPLSFFPLLLMWLARIILHHVLISGVHLIFKGGHIC